MKNEIMNWVQGLPGTAEVNTESSPENPQKAQAPKVFGVATFAFQRLFLGHQSPQPIRLQALKPTQTDAAGRFARRIVCNYFIMNALQNKRCPAQSSSLKANRTGSHQVAAIFSPRRTQSQSNPCCAGAAWGNRMACQPNRGNNLKMPKMPKSVQRRGQVVTAPCRVVPAFVTGCPMLKPLIDNMCDGVTAPDPWTPCPRSSVALPAFAGMSISRFTRLSWSIVPIPLPIITLPTAFSRSFPTLNCWLISNRFRPFQSDSKQKKEKKEP
ncbi:MAG: hypothetical protein ACLQU4_03475 [Limisphaerales bacterium]